MDTFNNTTIAELKADLEDAFSQLSTIHGLNFNLKSFIEDDDSTISCQVKFRLMIPEEQKYADNFKKEFGGKSWEIHPKYLFIKLSDLNRISTNGKWTLVGFNNRNGKNKFMVRDNTSGVIQKISYASVTLLFNF